MKRKSIPSKKPDKETKQQNEKSKKSDNISSSVKVEISSRKALIERFGIDRMSYSVVAILIFLSGIYFGVKYLPAYQEGKITFTYKEEPIIKRAGNLNKRSTTASFSDPEDFFPAAISKQGAILIGCQNNHILTALCKHCPCYWGQSSSTWCGSYRDTST